MKIMSSMSMEDGEMSLLDASCRAARSALNTPAASTSAPNNANKTNNGNEASKASWTDSYSYWSKWEDTEEINRIKQENDAKANSAILDQSAAFMGHDHDHSAERKLLKLSEKEKMVYCEKHRLKGNYLFLESMFPKAAEQYQLALSHYEYCFPEDDKTQGELDELRHACLCNISLCYYRMGSWRMALTSATQVLEEDENCVKALFRRAQANRALDEYGLAELDLTKASRLAPEDRGIQREIKSLQLQRRNAAIAEKETALNMLGNSENNHTHSHLIPAQHTHHTNNANTNHTANTQGNGNNTNGCQNGSPRTQGNQESGSGSSNNVSSNQQAKQAQNVNNVTVNNVINAKEEEQRKIKCTFNLFDMTMPLEPMI